MHEVAVDKRWFRSILSLHAIPLYLLIASCIVSMLLIGAFLLLDFAVWQLGLLVLVAWTPVVMIKTTHIYRSDHQAKWCMALLFVLVVSQTAHFFEHGSQMIQLHILGLKGPQAAGIISVLNTEWVHFIWNSWVLLIGVTLVWNLRKNPWMMMLFLFAIWHEIEHGYIMSIYLQTHIEGNPGLIAKGGLIGGGLPLSRPDVHFFYAVIEEVLLLFAYWHELRKVRFEQKNMLTVQS